MNNFDRVAPVYDRLVRLVFGNKLWEAQRVHLDKIKATDRVLILGGGTGRILEWMPDCEIDYLEKSEKMIELARRKGRANFFKADFLNHEFDSRYDWVICPFFLDCFSLDQLTYSLEKISASLSDEGQLLIVDFTPPINWRESLLLSIMHTFFRLCCGLSSRNLLDIHQKALVSGFQVDSYRKQGMLFSAVYRLS